MPAGLRWLLTLGPLNPIVVRLVQGGSRRTRHFVLRTAYLFVMMVALLAIIIPGPVTSSYKDLALRAASAFEAVAYLQIGLICVLAPVFMAGAIAQESNPRTWDILLTTPLSAFQMVVGHLLGRLFFVLALLFASLPFFALTQYFGGVPGSSILASYAVAACLALLVGAVAITLAVNRLAGRRAVFAYFVSMVTYVALTLAADILVRGPSGGTTALTPLNPFLSLQALLDPTGYPTPDTIELGAMGPLARLWFGQPVLAWCLVSSGLSAALVVVNTFTVRRAGQEGAVPWHRRLLRLGVKGSDHRAPRGVWDNPVAWREAAARQATPAKIVIRWTFIALGLAWAIAITAWFHGGGMTPERFRFALLATVWTETLVIVLVAMNISASAISREREDGTLDLLLTTPITPANYLGGKLTGVVSYLAPLIAVPVATLAIASLYALFGGFGSPGATVDTLVPGTTGTRVDAPVVLPEAALLFPLATLPFVAFCAMVGIQWSVRSRGTIGSIAATVAVVAVITGTLGLCGWQAGAQVAVVGPVLAALNPIVVALLCVQPVESMAGTIGETGEFAAARVTLAIGTALAAAAYTAVIFAMRARLTATFDRTVRALAGLR